MFIPYFTAVVSSAKVLTETRRQPGDGDDRAVRGPRAPRSHRGPDRPKADRPEVSGTSGIDLAGRTRKKKVATEGVGVVADGRPLMTRVCRETPGGSSRRTRPAGAHTGAAIVSHPSRLPRARQISQRAGDVPSADRPGSGLGRPRGRRRSRAVDADVTEPSGPWTGWEPSERQSGSKSICTIGLCTARFPCGSRTRRRRTHHEGDRTRSSASFATGVPLRPEHAGAVAGGGPRTRALRLERRHHGCIEPLGEREGRPPSRRRAPVGLTHDPPVVGPVPDSSAPGPGRSLERRAGGRR